MQQEADFGEVTSRFIEEIDSLAATLPLAMVLIKDQLRDAGTVFAKFLEERGLKQQNGEIKITIPVEQVLRFQTLMRNFGRSQTALQLVPRSFFVNLVSQFDAFVGRLIRALLLTKPEVLNASEKTLSLSELLAFGSIDAARDHIIEKEVETVIRKSHTEQFEWLESKFSIKLRQDLPAWPRFVELTERRNLYVHTGGRVSSHYRHNCQAQNVDGGAIRIGEVLEITPAYFKSAYETIFEVGVKLAQVFWRKLKPTDLKNADQHLVTVSYHLLVEEKYELAKSLLDFATEVLKKHSSTDYRLRLLVNRAQAYKWSGDTEGMNAVLAREDFSALNDIFRLSSAVLRDDFTTALDLVTRIGRHGSVTIGDYREWPLFRELRNQPRFEEVILDVFGEPLKVATETALPPELAPAIAATKADDAERQCSTETAVRPESQAASTAE